MIGGGSQAATLSTENHAAAVDGATVAVDGDRGAGGGGTGGDSGGGGGGGGEDHNKKEKSVLQAKLTKLAIQIGYAGNISEFFLLIWFGFIILWF